MLAHVELAPRAERDLCSLQKPDRARIITSLRSLEDVPPAENLDIRPLTGRPGIMRLRVGDWRILYRPLGEYECNRLVLERGVLEGTPALLVMRIVNRRDLERAIRALEIPEID